MDVAQLTLELAKTVGPAGALLVAFWWFNRPATDRRDRMIELLTEIRDGIRDSSHRHDSMMRTLDRIERRQSGRRGAV